LIIPCRFIALVSQVLVRLIYKVENQPSLWAFDGKVAATVSVTLGGLCGLLPLRMILDNIGVTVVPSQVAVSNGFMAYDESRVLVSEPHISMVKGTATQLI
jgi:hypothetical protein